MFNTNAVYPSLLRLGAIIFSIHLNSRPACQPIRKLTWIFTLALILIFFSHQQHTLIEHRTSPYGRQSKDCRGNGRRCNDCRSNDCRSNAKTPDNCALTTPNTCTQGIQRSIMCLQPCYIIFQCKRRLCIGRVHWRLQNLKCLKTWVRLVDYWMINLNSERLNYENISTDAMQKRKSWTVWLRLWFILWCCLSLHINIIMF